jgi:hypothetical protein
MQSCAARVLDAVELLNYLLGHHTAAGRDSMHVIHMYNVTMMHLDQVCDGIMHIRMQ